MAGGQVDGEQSVQSFQYILANASVSDTGFVLLNPVFYSHWCNRSRFIVLQHDLFEVTVDLASGYFLPMALNYTPTLKVRTYFVLTWIRSYVCSASLNPSASVWRCRLQTCILNPRRTLRSHTAIRQLVGWMLMATVLLSSLEDQILLNRGALVSHTPFLCWVHCSVLVSQSLVLYFELMPLNAINLFCDGHGHDISRWVFGSFYSINHFI